MQTELDCQFLVIRRAVKYLIPQRLKYQGDQLLLVYPLQYHRLGANKWERSEEFQHLIILTNIRRFENGILKV